MTTYKLIRVQRKTISLIIQHGSVIVRAPLQMSKETIDAFVLSKEAWIKEKLNLQHIRSERYRSVLNYQAFPYLGRILTPCHTDAKKIYTDGQRLFLPEKYDFSAKALNGIAKWYKREALKILSERLNGIAAELDFHYVDFKLTNARAKWGSCSAQNEIRLNWRLIMMDIRLIDYVIIHELCHTKQHNHSKTFWHLVSGYMPEYKEIKKALKDASVLTELFR